jgi:hypothetical protein
MDIHIPFPHDVIRTKRKPPQMVTSDLYDVAKRIKEIDPALILKLDEGHKKPWIVMEVRNGREMLVKRYEELSPAILDDLRYMASVPFMERYEKLVKEIDEDNAKGDTGMTDEKFERFAYDFHKAAVSSGLVHSPYHTSYRKVVRR